MLEKEKDVFFYRDNAMDEFNESNGKGSFWISAKAIEILIANRASATQINAYLVIAKHTDEHGRFSTSGIKAIHKATGVSHQVLEKATLALKSMGGISKNGQYENLLYSPSDWSNLKNETIPEAPFERAKIRFVINDFESDPNERVWFSNELVSGYGKFKQPLKKLKMCGDIAARLLLACYQYDNLEQYGGISPQIISNQYETKSVKSTTKFMLWHAIKTERKNIHDMFSAITGSDSEENKKDMKEAISNAIQSLDASGFIYEVVSVLDRDIDDDEAQVIYDLDSKNRFGFKNQTEEGVGGRIAKISSMLALPVTDASGRFYKKYAAITPTGLNPYVIGVYRLRFRVSNQKNYGVSSAWQRIHQGYVDAMGWIDEFNEECPNHTKNRVVI